MKYRVVSTLVALLAGCAGPAPKSAPPEPPSLAGFDATTAIACRYAKHSTDGKTDRHTTFYLWREAQRVETRDEFSQQGEIWTRDNAGRLFYTRLFYPDRIALDYRPGDLAATGSTVTWEQASTLIDPRGLGTAQGKQRWAGVDSETYHSATPEATLDLEWLPQLKLPARILKQSPTGTVELRLQDCAALAKAQHPPLAAEELDNLRHIDFSDLGDMESDPAVQRIAELTGGHSHHHHDGHDHGHH